MLYFFIKFFENALDPSRIAAFFLGPNTRSPSSQTHPRYRQLTDHPFRLLSDRFRVLLQNQLIYQIPLHRSAHTLQLVQSQHFQEHNKSYLLLGLCATFQAMACSLPPPSDNQNFHVKQPPFYTLWFAIISMACEEGSPTLPVPLLCAAKLQECHLILPLLLSAR